ncbi:hypothetical protein HZH68_001418 [Vespula germanica]|uniref:Uncharacterized protein n=1 Tax=Vespula germanica TaxID=30212 RepID=A0A834NVE7_VESGE|nr:hypothetical protein HZH68_001418 [Vespula germanica]
MKEKEKKEEKKLVDELGVYRDGSKCRGEAKEKEPKEEPSSVAQHTLEDTDDPFSDSGQAKSLVESKGMNECWHERRAATVSITTDGRPLSSFYEQQKTSRANSKCFVGGDEPLERWTMVSNDGGDDGGCDGVYDGI